MITQKELAQMCNVSTSTVSNILNGRTNMSEETRNKVLEAIEKTGYRPNFFAQGMRRQNNKCICIIAEELLQFSTPPIVEAIMNVCEAKGYRTILINMSMYEKWKKTGLNLGEQNLLKANTSPALLDAKAMKADGVIYVAAHGHILDIIPEDYGIPVVFAYGNSLDNKYRSVLIDDFGGSEILTKYLIKSGHRNIGVITGRKDNMHTVERLKGFRSALEKCGIKYDDKYVMVGDWERESGKQCARTLIGMGVKTIWCMNDLMAAGAYDALIEEGLTVGKDASVFGFDNRDISEYLYPKLSTCELPLDKIGKTCAELIIQEIEDESFRKGFASEVHVPCRLVLRDSVV
ncbi:MAG: LacI family DNA-binding transcriptional regulator, partial [Lachnospiraceae bacterium]|nr:LacI family DNA-binding transcriptional regulator [Lachnospiraceae bacterium]